MSPFARPATVSTEAPAWPGTAGMLATTTVLAPVGLWAYKRRDLRLA